MLAGIGTDIVEIGRIKKACANDRFLARVFTAQERAYCESRGAGRFASYAARFAGKEAVMKALGTGLRGGRLLEIEILPDALGAPQVTLTGAFHALAVHQGIRAARISLSHAREYATAVCVLEK